jgi:hypothetical protein
VSRAGRLLRRLTGGVHLDRLAAIEEKVGRFGRAQREDLAEQRRRLEELSAEVATRATTQAVRDLRQQIEELRASLAQQDRALAEALERARLFDEMAVDDRRFARRMEQMARRGRPIMVGPWTGEVGFELLYWVPFVRWAAARYGLAAQRLVVVSRGGAGPWYGALAARYLDVFSYVSPDEFRAATEDAKKQRRVGDFDARIVERVRDDVGLGDADLLHPGMMYRLFMPFWRELATMARVEAYTEYARIDVAEDPIIRELPADYVAARFYFSDCFPDSPANREFVVTTLDAISRQLPVVVLNTPFSVDDHRDAAASGGRIVSVSGRMVPERNLALQTAVIRRARAFVGTYGGYSYLAPFCGVTSLAFYSARTFKAHHLHLAQRVFDRLGGATVVPLDTAAWPVVRLAIAGALATTP